MNSEIAISENAILQSKMTRRAFGIMLPSAALLSQKTLSQASANAGDERDGDTWKASSESMKYGYVLGFTDAAAWVGANVEGALHVLKSLSAADRKILGGGKDVWDYGGIKYKQLIDGMNTFYGDYRNAAIKWDRALSYVRDTIHGEPQGYLDKELELERKFAVSDAENK